MKKLIRTTAVALSTIMLFTMVGCAKKEDPKAVFDNAIKKNSELTAMDMDMKTNMTLTQGEQNLEMALQVNMKVDKLNTEEMVFVMDMATEMAGQKIDVSTFYTDGYCYTETAGQKMKTAMALDEIMETVKQSTETTSMTSEEMKDISIKEDGDNRIITFTADAEKMDSYVQEMLSSMGGMASGMDGVEMTFKEANGEYTINKDGYYTAMKMHMSIDMTMQGETVSMVMDVEGTINNPGQPVEITLPSTDGYTEV